MKKKLTKFGNSSALTLDKTLLALLGISEGDMLELRIEGETLIVKKAKTFSQAEQDQADLLNEYEKDPKEQEEMMKKLHEKMMSSTFKKMEETLKSQMDSKKFEEYKKDFHDLISYQQTGNYSAIMENPQYGLAIQKALKRFSEGETTQQEHEHEALEAAKLVSLEFYESLKTQKEKAIAFEKKWGHLERLSVK